MDLNLIKRVGIAAAYHGAAVLQKHSGHLAYIHKKSAIDLVTEADTQSEAAILNTLKSHFPNHTIVAEESGLNAGDGEAKWIVDPLDGTTNYAHNLGLYAISIAFALHGRLALGIVLSPVSRELFTAVAGGGACLNDKPIRVSTVSALDESLLVTGFPYNLKACLPELMQRFENCLTAGQGMRRLGSAALDLCYVACGRFEGFWEQNLKPWDTAACVLIAQEAGAVVTDFANQPFDVDKNEILATNGHIHQQMLSLLRL